MTVSPDARTPSADIHTLSGSTPPGAVVQPFGIPTAAVHETPDTFQALPDLAAGIAGRLRAPHPDAEVIDLAGQMERLAERLDVVRPRVDRLQQRVEAAHPRPPRAGSNAVYLAHEAETRPTEDRIGLTRIRKARRRMLNRLVRWTKRLAEMKPLTQAGLAAKAAVALAVRDQDRFDFFTDDLSDSVSRDALRIIGAEADARAEQDRQADGELLALGRAWEVSSARYERACAVEEALDDARALIAPPRVLLARSGDIEALAVCPAPDGSGNPFGKPWYGELQAINNLRRMAQGGVANARRDEILAAYDHWRADVAAENERSGLTAATAERKSSSDENAELRARICMMPSRTRGGVDLKHRVVLWLHDGVACLAHEMEPENVEHPQFSSALALSAVLDLARLASAEPAAVPAPATGSNIRPVPLPADLSALRLGADAAGDVREWYRSWLYAELRLLNLELDGSAEGSGIRQDNPGAAFHYPAEASWMDVPKPSTRAAVVLGLLGLIPLAARDGWAQPAASAA